MAQLRAFADRLIGLSATIGSLGLLLVVAVILSDVVGRSYGASILGARDLSEMTMVIVVFGGMALCDRQGGHIAVDLIEGRFPARMNRVIDALSAALGALIFFAIAYTVYDSSKISQMLNLSTNLLYLPKAWFQWALSGFAVITAIGMAVRALELTVTGVDVRPGKNRII